MPNSLPRTCVTPQGCFRHAVHKPSYMVDNLRESDLIMPLGHFNSGQPHDNLQNFPEGKVEVKDADWIFEVFNPFPFRGATYITKSWADAKRENPQSICLAEPEKVSLKKIFAEWFPENINSGLVKLFAKLPRPLLLSLAANSTDPDDLVILAELCCDLIYDQTEKIPIGLSFEHDSKGRSRAVIHDHALFEVLVNNYYLPDSYKDVMVLRPGVQGKSEIVGEWHNNDSHIFEYLRRNSYIPWGHYAANMANDSIRYNLKDLSRNDISGLRHLYYQRTYTRLSLLLNINLPGERRAFSQNELEDLRIKIIDKIQACAGRLPFTSTLWGWNYGFDCASSGYRLHASHQMIHQQFALLPDSAELFHGSQAQGLADDYTPYGCGDLVADLVAEYKQRTKSSFFDDYHDAIIHNQRMDGRNDLESSLIVYEDKNVILFVPKAQTSQWELQLMPVKQIGNILEADIDMRFSLDTAIHTAMHTLTKMGARMISTIEFPKRIQGADQSQRLLYSFLPKLPESPGAFSEAQLRWINGHYPEDFARACRYSYNKSNDNK